MTKKQFAAISRSLAQTLSGFSAKGQLVFVAPVDHTIRGIFLDGSSFDRNLFFAEVFLQPLFVPSSRLVFNVGWRVGGGAHRWDARSPHLLEELGSEIAGEPLAFLNRAQTPGDVAALAASLQKTQDPYVQQVIAFALARAGDCTRAVAELRALVALLDDRIEWQGEMAERARRLSAQLRDDPSAAAHQLERWEIDTSRLLGLNKYRSAVAQ